MPAELFVTDGKPDLAPVTGTQLLYVRNTESDLLMDIAGQQYYLLISGRWYRAESLEADSWQFVPFEELPADFANIPADSDLATVRASVPGTAEAKEALLETHVPQTAEVDRKTATCAVKYDGDPEFEVCGDNGVAYARNSDKPVLLIDKRYYCVDSAVWFESDKPAGPWQVSTAVPAAVQDIPPECPVYNVKYVYIYDSTPEVVYVGYTAGYYGAYGWGPCVVYGTGWYYQPWYGAYYYPRPVTYGFGVHYNPYTGWGCSFGVSYGWITVGVAWGRPPYNCWGPGGLPGRLPGRLLARLQPRLQRRLPARLRAGRRCRPPARLSAAPGRAPRQCLPQPQRRCAEHRGRTPGARQAADHLRPQQQRLRRPQRRRLPGQRTAAGRSAKAATGRPTPIVRPRPTAAPPSRPTAPGTRPPTASRRSSGNGTSSERDQQREREQQVQRDQQRQQQLDRDRADRSRGAERQQQAPSRSGGGQRGGGGRRR